MQTFLNEDFLLTTDTAKRLYHNYAGKMPILDYHCHISPREIYENRRFENITQLWMGGDHYKWRLMRANGIEENYITGTATDWEKFEKWAQTLELAIGNPLYHWSHLELKRYFGYEGHLGSDTAREVWELCNRRLQQSDMGARDLITKSNVSLLCTTDDPVDTLEWHKKLAKDTTFQTVVLPAFRADRAMQLDKEDYIEYLKILETQCETHIDNYHTLMQAVKNRMDYFEEHGCCLADAGLIEAMYEPASESQLEEIFGKRMRGEPITTLESKMFQTAFLLKESRECEKKGWVMQIHYGCLRNNNKRAFGKLGADTGYDCICPDTRTEQLAVFLNALEQTNQLPKMILYSLNPSDDVTLGTIIGCFQKAGSAGLLQHGSAWWFNDNQTGITNQMISLAEQGLLGNFVGMLTDSRSFLSYTRHEYFRRILCRLIGGWVENGEYPADEQQLKKIIEGICYENAQAYFAFSQN